MQFETVYIIGSGSICVNIIKSLLKKNIAPHVVTYNEHQSSNLFVFAQKHGLQIKNFTNKHETTLFFKKIEKKSLIISANNLYLFPAAIIEKENLKIINFHNALLPKHRGVCAPSWSIFEQDEKTGITWHIINKEIDLGEIIIQKEISIEKTDTSLKLVQKLMNLAFLAYQEIEDNLLNWKLQTKPIIPDNSPIHFSKDIPNNGFFNTAWNFDKKSAFLRAIDLDIIQQILPPAVQSDNNTELRKKFEKLRKNNPTNFFTNFYSLHNFPDCQHIQNDTSLIFWTQEYNFYKIYYAFSSLDAFEVLLKELPLKQNAYLEIVSNKELSAPFYCCVTKFFIHETTYQKLYKKIQPQICSEFPRSIININDVYEKLFTTFNICYDHIMSNEKFIQLLLDNKVLTIYEENTLKSFIIYKKQGKKAYLNHIANFGSKQNLIELWKKFYQALYFEQITYIDLWYDTQNKKAENMYKIEQFQPLSMYNYCFKKL